MTSRNPRREAPVDTDFFDDAYYRLLEPFHSEEEARAEAGALRELLGLALTDRILDLGCGWGRHLSLLAGAGHEVIGIDLSLALLRRARARTGGDTAPDLVAGDMLRLPLATGSFDAVLNLATSLGLLLEDAEAGAALAEACRVLRPGGRFLLEGMHRADVEARFAVRDAWTLDDGTRVRVRRRFDPETGVSREVLRWEGPGGQGRKRHALRLRTGAELQRLVEGAGLSITSMLGDWDGEPFGPDAPRVILVAERPEHS